MTLDPSLPHNLNGEIIITDTKTGIIEQKIQAQSFVKGMLAFLGGHMGQALGSQQCLEWDGVTTHTFSNGSDDDIRFEEGLNSASGILCGTDATAVDVTDFALGAIISTGNLTRQTMSWTAPVTVSSDRYFEIIRAFTNISGGDIDVKEVALYTNSSLTKVMIERSLVTFTIPDTETKTVTYRIKITV